MKKILIPVAIAAIATFASTAWAGQDQGSSMIVGAEVATNCSVTSAGEMDFGSYSGSQIDQTATIGVTCSVLGDGNATISLGDGANWIVGAGAPQDRRLKAGTTHFLSYKLFGTDATTGCFGGANVCATGITKTVGMETTTEQNTTVYGTLAGGQPLYVGNYGDSVLITLDF